VRKIAILVFIGFLCAVSTVSAQANENEPVMRNFGFNWGISFIIQPDVFQRISSMGVNFKVFDNGKLHIRNHVIYNGGVLNMEAEGIKYAKNTVSDKITAGVISHDLFYTYGYLEGGIGSCGIEYGPIFKSKVSENPLYGSVELGAGFEVLTLKHLSLFAEIGFHANLSKIFQKNDLTTNEQGFSSYGNGFMMQQRIQLGLRTYL